MLKKLSILACLIVSFFSSANAQEQFYKIDPLDNMPIFKKAENGFGADLPVPQRDERFRQYLATSVKLKFSTSSGSGTIVYYDREKNLAYVASCGHFFQKGTEINDSDQRSGSIKCKVEVWYHNDVKLPRSRDYDGKVMFYSYYSGQDTSMIIFTPDWQPDYFPIAPVAYQYVAGVHAHSLGSDHGSEAAHYDIELIGFDALNNDVVTRKNSPRPGRSGGGLISNDGFYIGTCWGTEFEDGSGVGRFTSLKAIHKFWGKQKKYSFLLNIKKGVPELPIIDKNGPQGTYPKDYVFLPKN